MIRLKGRILPRLFAIQFLSWSAMFCLWIDGLPVIASLLGRGVEAAIPTVGFCFSGYAVTAAFLVYAQPWLFARMSAGTAHGWALLIGATGMAILATATNVVWLVPAFGGLAVCWSTMGTIPYAAAAAAASPGQGAETLRRFGFSTVIPQAVTTLGLAALAGRWWASSAIVMRFGATELAAASLLTFLWRRWITVPVEDW